MATPPPRNAAADLRSGGKMVRPRRPAGPRTPYDRPPLTLPPSTSLPEPTNPNWLSRFLLSPTRFLANGAGKVLSFAFRQEDSESESESDSGSGNPSDDDVEDGNNDNLVPSQGDGMIAETKSAMEIGEPLVIEWKSEAKREISRLVMQETFSREECDRLTSIIKSRVLDTEVCTPDHRHLAALKARKWLDEKKSRSSSKSELEYGTCVLNTDLVPREGEAGSPVDLARSYMRSRPPWASPSTNQLQFRSPSSIGIRLLREETSSVSDHFASSSKRIKDSRAMGSWSLLEELRKVRSRATEEMLRTRPSSKIDWSTLASDYQSRPLKTDNVGQDSAVEIHNSAKIVDVPLDSSIRITSDVPVIQIAENGVEANQLDPFPDKSHLAEAQVELGMETVQALASSTGAFPDQKGMSHDGLRLQPFNDGFPVLSSAVAVAGPTGVADHGGLVAVNGFSLSSSRQEREKTSKPPPDASNNIVAISGHDKTKESVTQEMRKVLSEDFVEVPITQDNESIANDSQDSSSIHTIQGAATKQQTRQKPKRSMERKIREVNDQQAAKKFSKYNNRGGRGRGRGRGQAQVQVQVQGQ